MRRSPRPSRYDNHHTSSYRSLQVTTSLVSERRVISYRHSLSLYISGLCHIKSLISPEVERLVSCPIFCLTSSSAFVSRTIIKYFNIWLCKSLIHLPVTIMTAYDYLTPFEDQVQRQGHLSRELPLPHPDTDVQATESSTSIGTPYFDAAPAFSNPPQPFTILSLTPEPPSSYKKVPELSHRVSTHSSSSDVSLASSPCKSCGLIPADKGLLPEHGCCHICPDIARERECPDIHPPSETEESRAQSRRPSGHHRRRHSLLYERPSPVLRDDLDIPEEHSNCHSHVDNSLEEECGILEQESNMLGRESNPLEYEASPLGQVADAPEKLDSAVSPCSTDTREHQSEVKARQEEWERHCRLQKAQKQLLKDNAGPSPPHRLHMYGNQSCMCNAQPGKVPDSGLRMVSFYGKCL
jgi:hypothetical protein